MIKKLHTTSNLALLAFVVLLMMPGRGWGQTTQTWSGNTSWSWLTSTNWSSAVPGSKTTTTNNDIAYFNNIVNVGVTINMNTQGGAQYLGALNFGTSATTARSVANSSATGGTMYFNGVALNGVNNTILWNQSSATHTFTNGAGILNMGLNATDHVIQITGTGGVTIASVITGTSKNLEKAGSGSGVLTLTGVNTYTGTTLLTAGELRLNPTANLSMSGACTFNGGKLATTGIASTRTITFASINISDNTTLALLASTNHTITFTSKGTFASGKTLTITGWTGSYVLGTTGAVTAAGKVFIGSSASLTPAELSQIKFNNGTNNYYASQLSTGEIIPTTQLVVSAIGNQTAGVGFNVTVTTKDSDGNARALTNATGITLSTATGGTIAGTTTGTINAAASTVTISGVTLTAGTSQTITATRSSGDMPLAGTSAAFDVAASGLLTPPTLSADATANTVDNNIDITFPTDAGWEGAITAVKIGGVSLTVTTDYVISSGNIQLKPSGLNALLTVSGSKAVTVEATGYTTASVTQQINVGADAKLGMKTQPTAPATNGAVLATQPAVYIQDQYANTTTSTAAVVAAVGAGTWTLGGTTSVAGVAGTTTYSGLTATSAAAVTGATIAFTSSGLTGVTSNTFNIVAPVISLSAVANQTVDNNFNITFTDNASWRTAVTGITVDATSYSAASGVYSLTSGSLVLTTASITQLQTAVSHTVVVIATGYTNASVIQTNIAGVATKLAMKTQPAAPLTNGANLATQPAIYIKDQYNNTTTSTATVVAAVGAGTWTLGGTTSVPASAGTTTYSGLTATSAAAVTGATIAFTSGSLTGVTSAGFNIPVPLVNDLCSNATSLSIGAVAVAGTLVGSTFTSPFSKKDVWFSMVPTCTGTHIITVTGFSGDVDVELFSNSNICPSNITYLFTAATTNSTETISELFTSGVTYFIRVLAFNSAAESSVFTIGISGPTPVTQTVTAQAASSVTTTTATLNGNLTAIGVCPATTEKGFVYAVTTTNPDPLVAGTGVTKTTVASITTGAYTLALTGLTPGTGYSFKSYVYDGSSYTYGAVTTFTTLLVAPTVTAATGATVDAPFEMTFAENSAWRGAITGITVGGTSLTLGYSTAISGVIRFTPSASNPTTLLQTAGVGKSFVITATGYPTVTVSQTIGAGVATKLIMKTQPTAPATNGAVLAQQPAVYIEDQYGNFTTSTATVAAAVGAGTWTLGGTTSVAGVSGTTTFSGLTATSAAAVTGATIAFTSSGLTGVTSNTFNIIAPVISLSASANQTVDNNFNITFTDNASWRTAVTGITVDGTSYLAASGVYSLTSGSLVLTTASITQLQTAGSHIIVVIATGYTNATVTQTNIAGVATKLAMKTQPAAPATNGAVLATQPAVYIKDQYNNTTTSTASVVAAVGAGTWSLGGTTSVAGVAGTTTYSGLTASCSAAVTDATIAFSSTGLTGITSSLFSIPVLPAAPTSLAFGNILYNSFTSSFTAPSAAPTGYLVLRSVSSAVTGAPVAGTAYTLGQTNIGSGINEVVYVGASAWSAYAQTGLTDNTTYYYAIYSYNGSAATTSYSAALTGSQATAIITAPTAGVASSILSDGFTANWEVVNGASSYKIDVATSSAFGTTVISENFVGFITNNGSTDRSAALNTYLQTTGWTGAAIYEMIGYTKLGSASAMGYITTPTINLSSNGGNSTLTFDLGKYGTDAGLVQVYHATDGSNFVQVGSDITPPAALTTQTVQITGGTAYSKIKISAKTLSNNRFYLDNIVVAISSILSNYNNLTTENPTSQTVTGLTANTPYYYRVRAVGVNSTSANSVTITATTAAALAEPTNYATNFTAASNTSTSISLTWSDAIGAQLPENYLVKAVAGSSAPTAPVDGTAQADGTLVKNITYGTQTCTFTGLTANTTYTFSIWPYTNTGININYKTDGTVPSATASTGGYFRSYSSGNWGTPGTWQYSADGSTNWATAVVEPSGGDVVTILNTHHVSVEATLKNCKNLSIASGAILTINAGMSLTVSGTLTNSAGNAGLVLKSDASGTGSLIHNTADVPATIERYITGSTNLDAMMYHFVSVPLTSAAPTPTANLFFGSYLFDFNETSNGWHGISDPATTLDVSRGYLMYYPLGLTTTLSFAGPLNNGSFTALTSNSGNGYNLVPNPYPSAIDWNASSGWTKNNIAGTIYFWPAGQPSDVGNYAAWNGTSGTLSGTRYIPQGQSFFVQATGSSTLTMSNTVRLHSSQVFWKDEQVIPNLIRIKSVALNNNAFDELVVNFRVDATGNFDTDFDANKLQGGVNAPQFSSKAADNSKLAINCLPFASSDVIVPLAFSLNASTDVTFTASGMESFYESIPMYLEDLTTGTITDLRANPVYTFSHTAGDAGNRFQLRFKGVTGTPEQPTTTPGHVFVSQGKLFVDIPAMQQSMATLSVFDALGRQLISRKEVLQGIVQLPAPTAPGVYIVRVMAGNISFTGKVVVNQ